jgi:hypothetical protein
MTLFHDLQMELLVWSQVSSSAVLTFRLTCSKRRDSWTNSEIAVVGDYYGSFDWLTNGAVLQIPARRLPCKGLGIDRETGTRHRVHTVPGASDSRQRI